MRRTAIDYALFMQALVEVRYRNVDRIRLVQDNLNTHTPGSFYQAFVPQEAFALAQKFRGFQPRSDVYISRPVILPALDRYAHL
jgi:hypothetical protein